ncbi:SAM-dependent methyltransferase [Roseofilum casamattae]|uniref:Methyltransferase domain-containing protein n=1 Tax=Roseofilum casamattae BLCC-M143 TaxID=3022442 RepID=A0ABT7C2Z0_9CYAN|nr:class I SAM-dependent methyltransferase [Roseofilum casamattae]MDJ1185104.1 methyltransferase domain-containing protein [Roseofilum casamattae BLCC-M143]
MSSISEIDRFNQNYFNSFEMDLFYQRVSGEHTHCGLFEHPDEDLDLAKKRTTEYMASLLNLDTSSQVLDMGSGYGGAARYLAEKYGCQVSCLNLSEQQNEVNIARNEIQKLSRLIRVYQGSFDRLPFPESTFNFAWEQDSFFLSNTQLQAFREAHRVLVPGGDFLACTYFFTGDYPSEANVDRVTNWYTGGMHKVYFLHVDEYRKVAREIGMSEVQVIQLTDNVCTNYMQLLKKMGKIQAEEHLWSQDFFDKKKQRLLNCYKMGESGLIEWGIFHYRKDR